MDGWSVLWRMVGVGVDLHAVVAVIIEVESVGVERHVMEGGRWWLRGERGGGKRSSRMLLRKMFTRVAIATDNAGQGPIVTARDELRYYRATFFGHETRDFAHYYHKDNHEIHPFWLQISRRSLGLATQPLLPLHPHVLIKGRYRVGPSFWSGRPPPWSSMLSRMVT